MEGMDFSWALHQIKDRKKVCRKGWNGKNMWIELVTEDEWSLGSMIHSPSPFIVMKTVDDMLVPWLASQTDLLASDWELVESN